MKSGNYKKSELVDHRTINYRFSVKNKKDPVYIELKKVIEAHNQNERMQESIGLRPHYLRVRGRGRGCHTYKGVKYNYSIPDAAADYFDVYVVRDTDAMAAYFKRESAKKSKSLKTTIVDSLKAIVRTDNSETAGVTA